MVQHSQRSFGAVGRLAVLALLWGSTFLWIKLALNGFSPVQVTLGRCLVGAVTLLAVCWSKRQHLPRGGAIWAKVTVAALFCNALPFAMFSLGEQTADSGVAGVLNATTPLWSMLLGILIGTERRIRRNRLAGLVIGFAGTLLIFAPWQHNALAGAGALAILLAALSYAIGFAYLHRALVGTGHSTISLAAAQLLVATGLTACTLPIGGLAPVHLSWTNLLAVLVLGIACTATTFYLTFRVIADEGATNAASVGYLLPVVSVVLGAIVLNEPLPAQIIAGMVVVLIGLATLRWTPRSFR
jgi:drug/metabolite transporter (DMT)-like permease